MKTIMVLMLVAVLAALATAGVLFIINYIKECREARYNGEL